MIRDPYEILQVHRKAEDIVIDAAYRRLSKKYHPDFDSSNESTARMQDINWAYTILSSPSKREQWDKTHQMKSKDHNRAEREKPVSRENSTSANRAPITKNEPNAIKFRYYILLGGLVLILVFSLLSEENLASSQETTPVPTSSRTQITATTDSFESMWTHCIFGKTITPLYFDELLQKRICIYGIITKKIESPSGAMVYDIYPLDSPTLAFLIVVVEHKVLEEIFPGATGVLTTADVGDCIVVIGYPYKSEDGPIFQGVDVRDIYQITSELGVTNPTVQEITALCISSEYQVTVTIPPVQSAPTAANVSPIGGVVFFKNRCDVNVPVWDEYGNLLSTVKGHQTNEIEINRLGAEITWYVKGPYPETFWYTIKKWGETVFAC